jgi:hypothetical protein
LSERLTDSMHDRYAIIDKEYIQPLGDKMAVLLGSVMISA